MTTNYQKIHAVDSSPLGSLLMDQSQAKELKQGRPRSTNPKQLQRDCNIDIDLSDLFIVQQVVYQLQGYASNYTCIILEIVDPQIRMQYNNAKYLLQVWDKSFGKAYEKPLKCTFKSYELLLVVPLQIYFYSNCLTFRLDPKEENEYWIYAVFIGYDPNYEKTEEIKIKDYKENENCMILSYLMLSIVNMFFFNYKKGTFIIASSRKAYGIGMDSIGEEGLKLDVIQEKWKAGGTSIYFMEVPESLHLIKFRSDYEFVFQNNENTITSVYISTRYKNDNRYYWEIDSIQQPPSLKQLDPVQKFITFQSLQYQVYDIVITKSKQLEIYANKEKVFSSSTLPIPIQIDDCIINNDYLYLSTSTKDQVYQIPMDGFKKVEINNSKLAPQINSSNWRKLWVSLMQDNVKLIKDSRLIGTTLFLTCDNMLLKYDLLEKKLAKSVFFFPFHIKQILEKDYSNEWLYILETKPYQVLQQIYIGGGQYKPTDPNEPKIEEKTEEQKLEEAKKEVTKYYQVDIQTGEVKKEFPIEGKIIQWVSNQITHNDSQLRINDYVFMHQVGEEKKVSTMSFSYAGIEVPHRDITSTITGFNNTDFTICNVYTNNVGSQYSYFGVINSKEKTFKSYYCYKYYEGSAYYENNSAKLDKFPSDYETLSSIHTVAYIKDQPYGCFLVMTLFSIYQYDTTEETFTKKFTLPYNLSRQQFDIIQYKYLYYQDSEGLKILNLKTVSQNTTSQDILINYTMMVNNQIQGTNFDRFTCFLDNLTFRISPLVHKNAIIPFGFFNSQFNKNKILNTKLITINDFEYQKLVAFDEAKNLITWEYPTGRLLKCKNALLIDEILNAEDKIYDYTDLHFKRENRSLILYYQEMPVIPQLAQNVSQNVNNANVNSGDQQEKRTKNYMFKIIEIESTSIVRLVKKFEQIIEPGDRLHFSEDLRFQLFIEKNDSNFKDAKIYSLDDVKGPQFIRSLHQFPYDLYTLVSDINILFSPDLMYYIEYDKLIAEYKIVSTLRNYDRKKLMLLRGIPFSDQDEQFKQNEHLLLKGLADSDETNFDYKRLFYNFKWESSTQFRFINSEGIQKVFHLNWPDGVVKEKFQTQILMKNKLYSDNYYYYERDINRVRNSNNRLLRRIQNIISLKQSQPAGSTASLNIKDFEYYFARSYTSFLYIEHPYTYYHWKMSELIIKKNQDSVIDAIGEDDLKNLLLSIFPGMNTFFHRALDQGARKKIEIEKGSEKDQDDAKISFNLRILKKMFKILYDDKVTAGSTPDFFFPFIKNAAGQSPFELCLITNISAAEVFLKYLKYQPIFSHSQEIITILPKLISMNLYVGEYLDSRLQQTELIKKEDSIFYFRPISGKDYEIKPTTLWPDMVDFKDQFKENPKNRRQANCFQKFINFFMRVKENTTEIDCKLEILDIPYVCSANSKHQKVGEQFFKSLSDVDGYDLFKFRSIQTIIEYKWSSIRNFTLGILFFPFLLYFGTFITYSNVFNGQIDMEDRSIEIGFLVLSSLLFFFSLYFLLNEFAQLLQNKMDYFTDSLIWNILDIIPSVLIITVVSARLRQKYATESYEDSTFLDTVHAIASIMMWLKFLYFLRLFDATGYLIRIVISMVWDMKVFIFILFIVEIGFGEAFLRLSEKSGEAAFLENYAMAFIYAFRLTLGDNDTEAYAEIAQPVTAWILFVCCEVFTNIVMLNLLVTIIGQSFETINDNARLANFKERAKLISENSYLTKCCRCLSRSINTEQSPFVMIVRDTSNDDETMNLDQLKEIQDSIATIQKSFTTETTDLKKKMETLETALTKQSQDMVSKFDTQMTEITETKNILNELKNKLIPAKPEEAKK